MAETNEKIGEQEFTFLKRVLVVLFSGGSFARPSEGAPQYFSVERLIAEFGSSQELADLAAQNYLDRFDKSHRAFFRDTDALGHAHRIAEQFPISKETAERLVGCMAKAGWHGRLEKCARKYCNRAPSSAEVVALYGDYLNGASYSDSHEKVLAAYAEKYMTPKDAEAQKALVAERNELAKLDIY